MKNYLIHILVKEFSFWIPFFIVEKFAQHSDYLFRTEWWTTKEIIGTSFYMATGFIIINVVIFAILNWWMNKKEFQTNSFIFGACLHLISLVLIIMNVELEARLLNFFIAGILSLVISGLTYRKLNTVDQNEQNTTQHSVP